MSATRYGLRTLGVLHALAAIGLPAYFYRDGNFAAAVFSCLYAVAAILVLVCYALITDVASGRWKP